MALRWREQSLKKQKHKWPGSQESFLIGFYSPRFPKLTASLARQNILKKLWTEAGLRAPNIDYGSPVLRRLVESNGFSMVTFSVAACCSNSQPIVSLSNCFSHKSEAKHPFKNIQEQDPPINTSLVAECLMMFDSGMAASRFLLGQLPSPSHHFE